VSPGKQPVAGHIPTTQTVDISFPASGSKHNYMRQAPYCNTRIELSRGALGLKETGYKWFTRIFTIWVNHFFLYLLFSSAKTSRHNPSFYLKQALTARLPPHDAAIYLIK